MANIPGPVESGGVNGHEDLDFRDTGTWGEFAGFPSTTLLFGDHDVGPFAFLSSSPPSPDMMPTGFSHKHAADNWRISVRGTTDMGAESFAHGQFRFHDGGAPYAGDNLAWGPDGGFGLIVFGDRRGFAIQPVKAEIDDRIRPSQVATAKALGIDMHDDCPGAPAIVTSLGPTERSHQNGGFDDSASWPQLSPGVRLFVGLFGEPHRGPVILLVDAEPGKVALPVRTLETETLLVPVNGSVAANGATLEQGSIRLEHADVTAPELVAGPDGAQLVAMVGNRQALAKALTAGAFGNHAFVGVVQPHLNQLQAQLA